ncbi:MAG: two-component system regulatory protein YycI [Heyndrickxia sp.]
MEWSKTKTMFILVFLILDLFLATQFFNKYSKSQVDVVQNTSDEERLKADEITYDPLPQETISGQYIKAKSKIFTNKDIKKLQKNQSALLTKDRTDITSYFTKPIVISGKIDENSMDNIMKQYVLYSDEYSFWKYDKNMKKITYFQTYQDKKIFQNVNGQITFYLNDKNEIVSYEQTLLNLNIGDNLKKEEDVLPPIKIINNLHNKGMLKRKSHIKKPDLGYYTRVQSPELQLLVPTWHFTVENDGTTENFFVNAFEGEVFDLNNNSKVNDSNSNNNTTMPENPEIKSNLKNKTN